MFWASPRESTASLMAESPATNRCLAEGSFKVISGAGQVLNLTVPKIAMLARAHVISSMVFRQMLKLSG